MEAVMKNTNNFVEGANSVGLKIIQEKKKVMKPVPNKKESVIINIINSYFFEKIIEFKNQGSTTYIYCIT